MDGWSTMLMIHWVGLGFVSLWMLGTTRKEGVWGNALLFFNWFIAFFATWLFWEPALKGILSLAQPAPDGQLIVLGIGMVVIWVLFLVFLGVLRTATDALSKVKVAFHPLFDSIGAVVCIGLIIGGIYYSILPMKALLELGKAAAPQTAAK